MTAKEFIKNKDQNSVWCNSEEDMYDALREFAKFHVKAALEAAANNAEASVKLEYWGLGEDYTAIVDKTTILEAYPLENIK